jgi:cytidylate kinase
MASHRAAPDTLAASADAEFQGRTAQSYPVLEPDAPETAARVRTIRKSEASRVVIAISGQPGAGAREIGHWVARALGCDHYDRLILEGVARRMKATVEAIEARQRRPTSWWDRLQRYLERAFEQGALSGWAADPCYLPPSAVAMMPPLDEAKQRPKTLAYEIDEREYAEALTAEVRLIAEFGDSVIVHAAACAALPSSPEIFKVGVFAPVETRVNHLFTDRGPVEVEELRRELIEWDRAGKSLLQKAFRVSPDDPSQFDMTVNTGAVSIEDAAEHILSAVRTRIERRRGDALIGIASARLVEAPRARRATISEVPTPDDAYIKVLSGVDIFTGLPGSQVREIASLGQVVRITEGAVLASEETVGEAVYAVLDGQVELSAESEVGRITVRIAHAGEAFPLAAIIGTGKIITRAEAMTDLELWRVDRVAFQEFLKSRPEIGLQVYDAAAMVMADRYRQTLARLTRATERALTRSRPRISV